MPTYEITIPGSGTYQVESERPLSDAEAYQAAAANAQPRGVTEELVRGAGLALRGAAPVATGAALGAPLGPVGMLAGSLALPAAELGTQAANVMLPEKYQIPSPSSAVEGLLTRLGFPVPETTGERVIQAGGAGLGGFGGQIRGLQALSQTAASPVGRGIAQTMASEPGRQLAASAPSAMAGQTAYELTGSPAAGMVAGMGTGAAFGVGAKQSGFTREELAAKSS